MNGSYLGNKSLRFLPVDDGEFEVKDVVVHAVHAAAAVGGTAAAECDAVHPADNNNTFYLV